MKQYDSLFGSKESTGGSVITQPTTPTTTPTTTPALFMPILGYNCQTNYERFTFDHDDFCAVMKSTGATGFRVPGGTIANTFMPFDPSSLPQPEHIGNLRAKTGANIFIVLNMLTSTLDEQIAWLRKLYSLGVPIKFIELGNEFPDDSLWLKKFKSADGYVSECRRWVSAIRQIFSDIYFGVPAGNSNSWNTKVANIDSNVFLVWHYANSDSYTSADGIVDVAKVWSMIDAEKKARFAGIPATRLWVTEYNLKVKNKTVDAVPLFKDDEQHGIAARCIMQKLYNIGCSVVFMHNICMGQDNGAIKYSPGEGYTLSATGLATQSFILSTQ